MTLAALVASGHVAQVTFHLNRAMDNDLNTAPVDFARIVGLYIATLFVIWQIISFLVFRTLPGPPILVGGALIITGGLIVTFWHSAL